MLWKSSFEAAAVAAKMAVILVIIVKTPLKTTTTTTTCIHSYNHYVASHIGQFFPILTNRDSIGNFNAKRRQKTKQHQLIPTCQLWCIKKVYKCFVGIHSQQVAIAPYYPKYCVAKLDFPFTRLALLLLLFVERYILFFTYNLTQKSANSLVKSDLMFARVV